jgi:predicted nucleic acid-binding protein
VKSFVLDASVALAWFVDDPVPSYAVQIKQFIEGGMKAVVPALWTLEMANGFCMAERRGKLTAEQIDHGLRQLEIITVSGIRIGAEVASIREQLATARAFQLTAYDAVYLELARREGLPLATLDKVLRAAAAKAGVTPLK